MNFDAVVIGAGAAGMMCAAVAGQMGARVALIDHSERLAEKIRISGGGRCNFTNIGAGPDHYISDNSRFCRYALGQYTAQDFIDLVTAHRIPFHEKHKGQLFCDDSADDIIQMLVRECDKGRVQWFRPCTVESVSRSDGVPHPYVLHTSAGVLNTRQLVVATGGLPIPQIGASDFGLRLAKQFGLKLIETRPALVPLTFDGQAWAPYVPLAGVSLPVKVRVQGEKKPVVFDEDLLFTHRGLSGPAILQISSFWSPGQSIELDLAAGVAESGGAQATPSSDLQTRLIASKKQTRAQLQTVLAQHLPRRLSEQWLARAEFAPLAQAHMPDLPDKALRDLSASLSHWSLQPTGTEGYKKAEVMRGGVDTRALHAHSMECKHVPGLYFIGEVMDVTGWLGGYNFQWAWSSGVAAAKAVAQAATARAA